MTVDFSSEILPQAMREQYNILQILKKKKTVSGRGKLREFVSSRFAILSKKIKENSLNRNGMKKEKTTLNK